MGFCGGFFYNKHVWAIMEYIKYNARNLSIVWKEFVEFAWSIKCCFRAFGRLIHFVNDETGQNSVDCQTVN